MSTLGDDYVRVFQLSRLASPTCNSSTSTNDELLDFYSFRSNQMNTFGYFYSDKFTIQVDTQTLQN